MQIFFVIAGGVSLGLGILGIFLPVLPTTPFMLLTAACWMRGSTRLYNKLMAHPVLGRYIEDFRVHKSITLRVKCTIIATLWLTLGISASFVMDKWWLVCLLAAVGVGVTWHILSFKTRR